MKIGNFKRLDKTTYPQEQQDFVEQLAFPINDGLDKLYNLANNRISLKDNMLCSVKDVEVTVDSSGIPQTTTKIVFDIQSTRILGMEVIRATNLSNTNIYPTGGVFASFTDVSNGAQIDHVAGLPANNRFSLRIVIWGT